MSCTATASRSTPSSAASSPAASSPVSPVTPKTPADEGIEFFQSPVGQGDAPVRVYVLQLDADGGPSKHRSYIRLPPAYIPYVLRVSIEAGMPPSKNGVFKTNFPLDGGKFQRDRFTERKLPTDISKPIHVDLPISHAGAFVFWVEYDGTAPGERVKGPEGYFNVDPALRTKARSGILSKDLAPLGPTQGGVIQKTKTINLPLDGLSILTVVSKWMGPIEQWHRHFKEAKDRGYTMLHYTPLQTRGESDSPYSIQDQLGYDPSLFGDGQAGPEGGRAKVQKVLNTAREEFGLLSLTDVVLNHTANNSPWLQEHPEAGYSPSNTPHLTPALEIDTALIDLSGRLAEKGLPTLVGSLHDMDVLTSAVSEAIKELKLWQYYVLDVSGEHESVKSALMSGDTQNWNGPDVNGKSVSELADILRPTGFIRGLGKFVARFGVKVDGPVAAGFIKAAFSHLTDSDELADAWVRVVDVLNVPLYQEWEDDIRVAVDNTRNRLKYTRLDAHGPKLGEISKRSPLVEPYFTRLSPKCVSQPLVYSVANNGWIWNADPLQNFALLPSKAYLRREVIVWGDCVKLCYGTGPEDNPWLWQHMQTYVTSLAGMFDGFRLDNCHSTPLHVAVTMLDAARVVNPDLYVCAELFTGSQEMDMLFVKRLGVNSLVREAGNGWDSKEFSRLIYNYGLGKPVGSMDGACLTSMEELPPPTGKGPVRKCIVTPLTGSTPHALFYDLTHDNESLSDKRSAEDALSTGALVTFSLCAIGSIKGFDDLYPKLLNLVTERRHYELTNLGENSGIARIKRVLNALHLEMVLGGYVEGHVHQENDYIIVHRVQPGTQKGYILIAHTAFHKGPKDRGWISPIKLRRMKAKFVLGGHIDISSYDPSNDPATLRGLPAKLVSMDPVVVPQGLDQEGPFSEIIVPEYFPPGSVMVFQTVLYGYDSTLDAFCATGATEIFDSLSLVELNAVLYRADGEERDATDGEIGVYDVPNLGPMVYCGLEGWMHPLRHIMMYNDLGHPLCGHLRDGPWALQYVSHRLMKQSDALPGLKKAAVWFKERFDRVQELVPPHLRPKYFALVISEAYKASRRSVVEQCSEFVSAGHSFTQDLALCSVQMYGLVKSASLDPAVPTPSLAAGLPHFTTGWARCWGRDVFISLRGLFLTTGNFEGAKRHIMTFASTLKHGLTPNLLDSARTPRYNSRDSPWWMIQNIQDYVLSAPDGFALLSETVKRRFPEDETWVPWDDPRAYAYSSTIAEIIQEILQCHAEGIHFREYNAGPNLDMQMKDEGFNIDIDVDWTTGLIHGGNAHNCGTWMDKMGESVKADTKGVPATPRDGAPVEITGLVKSALRWLAQLSAKGKFPFEGVSAIIDGKTRLVTYKEWSDLIQANFEKCYYIPENAAHDGKFNICSSLVNRRGIYKDVYGSGAGREWSDYQFRPNFPIAMTVAPELFDEKHALGALRLADKVLRAPLGMKTLDPSDMRYRPNYDNSDDSTDAAIAKGLNYHNGPEWGWPLGFFLRAYLDFDMRAGVGKTNPNETLHYLHNILLAPRRYIRNDPWAGIPELTNENGAHCRDSCNTQAWSASTLLDFLQVVQQMT
ncbi:glycoside hydrolase family 13 protein [Fistulina hepatica ATCC 64428]|uniref:Glycogen debranching enzyme n=1 Tax=Fistulina hepatica ATCC 64428 TaxID=1128425 RepID=A0A0D7AM24_9AGAR|nr:glycoside hydrolase family 13 protein [Fistulina hepatica ATCC 64428]